MNGGVGIDQNAFRCETLRAVTGDGIYTNDAATLGGRLATDVSKSAALDLSDVRQAVDSFRRDDPQSATMLLRDTNRIHVYSDPEHRLAAVAEDYVSKEDRVVIFAPDKTEREELTRLIRADLHEQERLAMPSNRPNTWLSIA